MLCGQEQLGFGCGTVTSTAENVPSTQRELLWAEPITIGPRELRTNASEATLILTVLQINAIDRDMVS